MRSTADACGGAGLRLRSITGNAPKAMPDVAGRPFLELLLRQLHRHGSRRVILAVGYGKNAIRSYFGDQAFGLHLVYSEEPSPLGTGGALRKAVDLVNADSIRTMNGDSYTIADLSEFIVDYHEAKADVFMLILPADERGDYGSVQVDGGGKLVSFEEKQNSFHAAYLNAGIYMISRSMLYEIPHGLEISLERELFPQWLREGKYIKGFVCSGRCIDLGTPDRYWSAQDILATVEVDASSPHVKGQL